MVGKSLTIRSPIPEYYEPVASYNKGGLVVEADRRRMNEKFRSLAALADDFIEWSETDRAMPNPQTSYGMPLARR